MVNVLNKGSIPKHIAFIMDGNRRYATSIGQRKVKGHEFGFESLKKCLEWCMELGVKMVSLYAFSIDNFQRGKEEVEVLMGMARDKLKEISENNEFLQKHSINTKVYGNLDLAPKDVREAMELVMKRTEKNTRMHLNICFCYDSTYEIERAINLYHEDTSNKATVKDSELRRPEIAREVLKKYLLIPDEPDILVRTSSEVRLSNFMLFQCTTSILCFLDETWPELSILSIIKIIMKYQTQEKALKQLRFNLDEYERKALCPEEKTEEKN